MKKAVLIALAFLVCFAIFMHAIGQGAPLKDISLTGKDGIGVKVLSLFATIGTKGRDVFESAISLFSDSGDTTVGSVSFSSLTDSWYIRRYRFVIDDFEYCIYYGWDYSRIVDFTVVSFDQAFVLHCSYPDVDHVEYGFLSIRLYANDGSLIGKHSTFGFNYTELSVSEFLSEVGSN